MPQPEQFLIKEIPHSGQNLVFSFSISWPQLLQGFGFALPHSGHTFVPSFKSAPHLLQGLYLSPHSGQNLVFTENAALQLLQVTVSRFLFSSFLFSSFFCVSNPQSLQKRFSCSISLPQFGQVFVIDVMVILSHYTHLTAKAVA